MGQSSSDSAVYKVCESGQLCPPHAIPVKAETGVTLNPDSIGLAHGEDEEDSLSSWATVTTKKSGTPTPLIAVVALALAASKTPSHKAGSGTCNCNRGGCGRPVRHAQRLGVGAAARASGTAFATCTHILATQLANTDTHALSQMAQLESTLAAVPWSKLQGLLQHRLRRQKMTRPRRPRTQSLRGRQMVSFAAAIEEMDVTLPTTLASRVAGLGRFVASQAGS